MSVVENLNITVQRHVRAKYMDIAFPYKEAITNAYGLIDLTTTRVASRSLLCPRKRLHIAMDIAYEI